MTYYKKTEYKLLGFEKSKAKGKMYVATIENKKTKRKIRVHFGSSSHSNYQDKTGLNLYPHLIHGDKERRRLYRARHKVYLKDGYYSPSFFSWSYLW